MLGDCSPPPHNGGSGCRAEGRLGGGLPGSLRAPEHWGVLEQRWAQLSLCVGADRWVPLRMGRVLQSLLYLQVSETCCYQGAHG